MKPSNSRRTAVAAGLLGTAGTVLVGVSGPASAYSKVYEDRDVNVVVSGVRVPLSDLCAKALEQDRDVLPGPGTPGADAREVVPTGPRYQKLQFDRASLRLRPGGRWNAPAGYADSDVVVCVSVDPGNLGNTCPDVSQFADDGRSRSGKVCGSAFGLPHPQYLERAAHVVVYRR
ncbi:MAG: hypothetical protein QG608_3747 [Actinomycetota bacterium]|nr:hypothetical protein [Actinomycetota bacterium]